MVAQLLDADGNPPTVYRGGSITWTFPITDATVSPTEPKNLTGATEVALVISRHRAAPTRDLVLDLDAGITHDDEGGLITAVLTPAQTEALPAGERWAELWITDAAGRRELVGEGVCSVHETTGTPPAEP